MASVTLSGGTFYPTTVARKQRKAGRELVAADGTLNLVLRGTKFEWELGWERVTDVVMGTIYAVAALTTSFTFVDQHGTPYTVAVPLEGYSDEVSLIAAGGPTTLYYDVSLTIRQV
jgi:hypothetical protein